MGAKLVVDGKEIPMNDFVAEFLSSTLAGAVTTLHGVSADWEKIELKIER